MSARICKCPLAMDTVFLLLPIIHRAFPRWREPDSQSAAWTCSPALSAWVRLCCLGKKTQQPLEKERALLLLLLRFPGHALG